MITKQNMKAAKTFRNRVHHRMRRRCRKYPCFSLLHTLSGRSTMQPKAVRRRRRKENFVKKEMAWYSTKTVMLEDPMKKETAWYQTKLDGIGSIVGPFGGKKKVSECALGLWLMVSLAIPWVEIYRDGAIDAAMIPILLFDGANLRRWYCYHIHRRTDWCCNSICAICYQRHQWIRRRCIKYPCFLLLHTLSTTTGWLPNEWLPNGDRLPNDDYQMVCKVYQSWKIY